MVDIANWVAILNREDSPGGYETFSVVSQGELELFSVARHLAPLVRYHIGSPDLMA